MFYDLNIPWTTDSVQLQRTLAFADEREDTITCEQSGGEEEGS